MLTRVAAAVVVALSLCASSGAASAAPTADDVVGEIQAVYAGVKQVTTTFTQKVVNGTFGTVKKSKGKLWIKKPGKMRWDYAGTKKEKKGKYKGQVLVQKEIISNGKKLYVVEHDNKQVVEKKLGEDSLPVAVTFLYGKGDLLADFTAALDTSGTYGDDDHLVIELSPRKAVASYDRLFLVVDETSYHVAESVIIDAAGTTSHFRFGALDFDRAVEKGWFEVSKKKLAKYRWVTP